MRTISLLYRPGIARSVRSTLFCLWAGLAVVATPVSAAQDTLLPRAVDLMGQRNAAAAYQLLSAEESRRAGAPDYDYLLGISALDAGHVTQAIFALERVVANRPGDALAHAELARAYLAAGETDSARAMLNVARRSQLPAEAAVAIDRVLGALDQALPSPQAKWSAYAELGAGRDSNVNSANNAGAFAIPAFGGLLFTVAPEHRQRGDTYGYTGVGGNLQWLLSPQWKVLAGANGRATANRHVHEMNTSSADALLGVSHQSDAHTQTVAIQSNTAWVSSSVYRSANGASAQWQWQLDDASQWNAFVQWARQEYAGQAERNADRSVLGTAYARALSSIGALAYGSVYGADERTRIGAYGHFGHRALGGRLGLEQVLLAQTILFAEWQVERRRYGDTEPLFDTQRIDRQMDLLMGLRWTPASTWTVIPSLRRTVARSNVPLYDYRRTLVQIALRKEFP